MDLRYIGSSLPPGFRFYPSDEELVCHYLYKKVAKNEDVLKGTLVEIDLHTCEPWQLPEVAKLNSSEWYFFSFRDRKYATGYRTNRATISGYWKATGKDRTVHDPRTGAVVGMRKTLVFYMNRAPNGTKTCWIMHEFRLESPHMPPKEDWVLCRVFHKNKAENSSSSSNNNQLSPDHPNVFERPTSPNLATSPPPTDQNFPSGQNPNFLQFQNPNFLHLPDHEMNNIPMSELNAKAEDEYAFVYDMGFEESSSLVDPNFGETVRFDDDRNKMVFL